MIIGINGYSGSGKDTVGLVIQKLTTKEVYGYLENTWEIKKWAGKLKTIASMLTGIPTYKFEDQEFKKTNLGPEWNTYAVVYYYKGTNGQQRSILSNLFYTKEEADQDLISHKRRLFRKKLAVDTLTVEAVPMTVRDFLQKLGTDGLRNGLHANIWVNALMADYKSTWKDPEPILKNDYTITYQKNYGETSLIHYGEGSEAEVFNHEIVEPNWIITDTRFPNEAQAIKKAGGIIIRVDRPGVKPTNNHPSETSLDNWEFDYKIANVSDIEALSHSVHTILKKINVL